MRVSRVASVVLGTVVSGLVIVSFVSKPEGAVRGHDGRSVNSAVEAPAGSQFYVATTGNDSNMGTSTLAPWRTIQHAMSSATPGSTVNIMAGTYHETLVLKVSGTAGNYVTFQSHNFSAPSGGCGGYTGVTCGGDQVILDYSYLGTNTSTTPFFLISGKSYIRVQGLTFQNFTCTGAMQQGLRIDNGSSYVEFDYNKFLNLKNVYPSRDGTAALLAIRVWSPSNNITFTGNELGTIWTNMSEALTFDGSSASKGLVQDNYIHDTDQLGATTYNGANNITFRHNKLEYISVQRNGTVWFNNPSTALYADSGYSILMERNFINHAGVGFEALSEPGQSATHDITIRNNVVENSYSSGIVIGTWYSTTDGASVYNINVWNNTFYQNTPNVTIRPMVSSTVTWHNNIFYGSSNYANSLNWNPGNAAYNLYFGGNSGPGSNNLTSDPLFVSPSTGNFSLQS